jgi:DNA-directed RNA polymerase sigma subunit (sigma70/sigma32)
LNWLLEAIERVERTGAEAQSAIAEGVASIGLARRELVAGDSVSRIVTGMVSRGGRETRLKALAAINAFEQAVSVYRGGLIRAMVDDEKLTFTEVGRILGVSRQMTARLYHERPDPPPPETT